REQIKVANESNRNFVQYDPNEMHPEAIYKSRHLPFLKSKKFKTNTHDTKQWEFEVPNDI
ncbi:3965_t:CDS:2, partial [Dentiscutata erythropus]